MFVITGLNADDLKDLGAVQTFASTNKVEYLLSTIKLEACNKRLSAIATDRYSLGIVDIDLTDGQLDGEESSGIVPAVEFAHAVRSVLPKGTPVIDGLGSITVGVDTWSVAWDRSYVSGRLIDGDYPNVRALFRNENFDGTAHIGFMVKNYEKFVKFTKASSMKLDETLKFSFVSPTKPAYVSLGDRFKGLVMPMCVSGVETSDSAEFKKVTDTSESVSVDRSEIEQLQAKIVKLEADNAELALLNKELSDRAVIVEAEKIVEAVEAETVEETPSLEEQLQEIKTLTPKMIERAVIAVDRGDNTDAVLMYMFGSTNGKRAELTRAVISQFAVTA